MTEIYNLLLAEERSDDNGEVRTYWHSAGTAFPHKNGDGFNLVIPPGMSLSGRVLMLPRKTRENAAPDAQAAAEFNES